MKSLTYVEIDIDYCSLNYGVAPCQAEIGVTGDAKCFNTARSCQDRENFANSPVTLRFAIPTDYLPKDIEAITSLRTVSFTPAAISLGHNLGVRATLNASFADHPHSDTGAGFDKYVTERPYDPFLQGSFWGKFRARQPYLRGRPIRLIRGLEGQSLEEMDIRHYVIESFDGPSPDGIYTITAKDVLKLADNDRAQAPRLSNGFLVAAIDEDDIEIVLSPSGIGNEEYPESGYVSIGGSEICAFTRSDDTLTIERAQFGTEAEEHDEQDRVQLCLYYSGVDPANIIADLFENYADIDPDFLPVDAWLNETQSFLQRVYTALIPEPTGVNKLVSELVEQAALAIWWADDLQLIRLQVLRAIPTTAARFTEDNTLENSLEIGEQPEKRASQVETYFGIRNPLESVTDPANYRSVAATVDLQAATDYGTAIKRIYSRWIPQFGRSVALRINDIQLGRFRDPPRKFTFSLFKHGPENPMLGSGYRLEAWPVQDFFGARTNVPIQVTKLGPAADRYRVEAEEMLFTTFDPSDLLNRTIIIDTNTTNFNLRDVHDSLYPPIAEENIGYVTVTCIVESGVIVGSTSTSAPAFDVGDWIEGLDITVRVLGRIQGRGGNGGNGLLPPIEGQPGGTALYTRYPINVEVDEGEVWAGGGGGYGFFAGGGGGAGYLPGDGGVGAPVEGEDPFAGQPGTTEAGGEGGDPGRAGGGPGLSGQGFSEELPGGAPGAAIDGISFVTITAGPGDRRGPEVN